jgi:hypothetical protein
MGSSSIYIRFQQKQCKWLSTPLGCRRGVECKYIHVSLASDEETVSYTCEGCKDILNDGNYVVGHILNDKRCYFCLNCNDWIQHKANVFNKGWTLLDDTCGRISKQTTKQKE